MSRSIASFQTSVMRPVYFQNEGMIRLKSFSLYFRRINQQSDNRKFEIISKHDLFIAIVHKWLISLFILQLCSWRLPNLSVDFQMYLQPVYKDCSSELPLAYVVFLFYLINIDGIILWRHQLSMLNIFQWFES